MRLLKSLVILFNNLCCRSVRLTNSCQNKIVWIFANISNGAFSLIVIRIFFYKSMILDNLSHNNSPVKNKHSFLTLLSHIFNFLIFNAACTICKSCDIISRKLINGLKYNILLLQNCKKTIICYKIIICLNSAEISFSILNMPPINLSWNIQP